MRTLLTSLLLLSMPVLAAPKLTGAAMDSAKQAIKPSTPFADAVKTVTGLLGAPTKSEPAAQTWAVVEGSTCTELKLEDGGGSYGALVSKMSIDKMMKSMFDACAAKAKK